MILSSSAHAGVEFSIATADTVPVALITQQAAAVALHRGGEALLDTLCGERRLDVALGAAVAAGECWVIREQEMAIGFAMLRNQVLAALYVLPAFQRQGIASSFIKNLRANGVAIVDGLALPGDRATKSLYESIGWKARLLTMRGSD